MNFDQYKYVVVEGPIGVGKTTLACKIAEAFGVQALLDKPQDNPFLEKFYRDSARYALPAQMFFLFQRINQLRDLAQADLAHAPIVSDFLLDKDPIFASLTLGDDELNLYRQLYGHLRLQAPVPDLVIYLQAEPGKLIQRVKERGAAMDACISEEYLQRLCESYSRLFHDYEAAPVLIVNTEHLNPILRDQDFNLLLTRIKHMRGKREFFKLGQ